MFKISEVKKESLAKAIKVRKSQNRNMKKMNIVLDEGYKNVIIEMAQDYQVSTSVIIRVACMYFLKRSRHGIEDIKLGMHTDYDIWSAVIWIQEDLKKHVEKKSLEMGMSQSRFIRVAITMMYNDYLETSIVGDEISFEKTIADLIWEDEHSYEN